MPNTKPDLIFDAEGVCDACYSAELKDSIDWGSREAEFRAVVEKYKGKNNGNYDCIVPVSGGKDSHYQAYTARKYGLNILMVNYEPTVRTELGRKNLENIRQFGDLIEFRKSHETHRKMAVEGLRRVGDNEWPSHVGIFTFPVRMAVALHIPLILWGENSQLEYGGPKASRMKHVLDRRWLEEFGGLLGLRVEDMASPSTGLTKEQLSLWRYPSDEELRAADIRGLFLGYFFKWDFRPQTALMQTMGFSLKKGPVEGTYSNFENLDEEMQALHDHLKFVKFGFGRATDHACIDIRNGRITREEGVKLVKKYDGKLPRKSIAAFLKYTGMDKKEFESVIDSFTNKAIFETDAKGKFKRDTHGNLIKKYQDYSIETQLQQ